MEEPMSISIVPIVHPHSESDKYLVSITDQYFPAGTSLRIHESTLINDRAIAMQLQVIQVGEDCIITPIGEVKDVCIDAEEFDSEFEVKGIPVANLNHD
jgi:virulence-associated protein VagC